MHLQAKPMNSQIQNFLRFQGVLEVLEVPQVQQCSLQTWRSLKWLIKVQVELHGSDMTNNRSIPEPYLEAGSPGGPGGPGRPGGPGLPMPGSPGTPWYPGSPGWPTPDSPFGPWNMSGWCFSVSASVHVGSVSVELGLTISPCLPGIPGNPGEPVSPFSPFCPLTPCSPTGNCDQTQTHTHTHWLKVNQSCSNNISEAHCKIEPLGGSNATPWGSYLVQTLTEIPLWKYVAGTKKNTII